MKKTPPTQWKVVLLADVGSREPFFARISALPDLLGGAFYNSKPEIVSAIMRMLRDCLVPAFISLRDLRAVASNPATPLLTKTKYFDDMCKSLWSAYKDRVQIAVCQMGYDIGFLFENDIRFKKGCVDFAAANPHVDEGLIEQMKLNRSTWQSDLKRFRNDYLEHQKISYQEMAPFYSLHRAEELFERVWVGIEEILVILIAAKLPQATCLREIPDAERDPDNPKRFGFAFRPGQNQFS